MRWLLGTLTLLSFLLAAPAPANIAPNIAPNTAPDIAVDGRVLDRDGRGVPGARVELRPILPRSSNAPAEPASRAATGPDGRFVLAAPGPGMWTVRAETPGDVSEHPLLPLLEDTSLLPLEPAAGGRDRFAGLGRGGWRLPGTALSTARKRPPVRIAGRVVERAGSRPLPGAWVWPEDDPGRAVRTDKQGRFHLEAGETGLRAAARGYLPVSLSWKPGSPPPVFALLLSPVVNGSVVDGTGAPLPGAEILLFRRDAADAWAAREDTHRARTSASGAFRIPGVQAGASYDLMVSGGGSAEGFAPAISTVSVPRSGTPPPLRVTLKRGRTVAGRVVDGRGRPLRDARVELTRSRSGRSTAGSVPSPAEDGLYRAVTGADGRFELPYVPAGRFDLRVEARGYSPFQRAGLEVPEGDGQADLGRFTVERGTVLGGRVGDPEGRPIPDAEVWVVPRRQDQDWLAYYRKGPAATTGPEGEFEIPDLPPGDSVSLDVCRPGYLPTSVIVREVTGETVEAVLEPAARLAGRVVDPAGSPVAGAQLAAWLSGEAPDRAPSVRPCRLGGGSTRSDEQGRFTLEPLPPGWWTVRAGADGWLMAESERRQVLAGESLEGLEIVLARGAVVAGRVLSPEGVPVAGAEVRTYSDRGSPTATTGGDGLYRLEGVEPGERGIEATHPDYEFASGLLEVLPGENRLDLTLEPDRRREIRGRVLGQDGAPVAGARVLIPSSSSAYSAPDGSFVLLEKDGTHEISADKEGYAPAQASVTVEGRPVEGIEIRLGRGGAIRGRLLGLDREHLAGATVEVDLPPPFQHQSAVDPQGGYRIAGLPPGVWEVTARAAGRQIKDRVELAADDDETLLDLLFAPTSEVSGQVLDPGGQPVPDATVRLFAGGPGGGGWTFTRSDGSFRIELEDGTYRGFALKRGYLAARLDEPVRVEGAPVEGIELRLQRGTALSGRILGLEPGERAREVWAEGPDGAIRQGELDQQGQYTVSGLVPGDWKITASFEGRKAVGRLRVEEGRDEVYLDLEFEPAS